MVPVVMNVTSPYMVIILKRNLLTTYVVNYVYKHDHPFNGKPRKLRNIQRYTFKFQQLFAPPDVFSECLCNYNLNSKGKF
jgi:hypothetical protein